MPCPLQLTSSSAYGFVSWALTQQCIPNSVPCNITYFAAICFSANQCAALCLDMIFHYKMQITVFQLVVLQIAFNVNWKEMQILVYNMLSRISAQSSGTVCHPIPVNCGSDVQIAVAFIIGQHLNHNAQLAKVLWLYIREMLSINLQHLWM